MFMCIAVMTIVTQFYTYMTYMCRTVKDHVYSCNNHFTVSPQKQLMDLDLGSVDLDLGSVDLDLGVESH